MVDEDARLMQLVSRGDRDAFRALITRYERQIYNFFLRMSGNVQDAEDLTQQLFINLFRSAARYRPSASFRTYIYRIASNLAVSFARKRKREKTVSLEQVIEGGFEPAVGGMDTNPQRSLERRELERGYTHALAQLPADWRTAIELRVGRGFSYREISAIMGKSLSAVESYIFRARERLAAALAAYRKDE